MGEEITFEKGLMTLTFDRVILHTIMHHSSTSTHTPNFIEIKETFCERTDGRTDGHLRPTLLGHSYPKLIVMDTDSGDSCRKQSRKVLFEYHLVIVIPTDMMRPHRLGNNINESPTQHNDCRKTGLLHHQCWLYNSSA